VGETFFNKVVAVDYEGGALKISGSSDGKADFYVDDLLSLEVRHKDGTVSTFNTDDSQGCTADTILTAPAQSLKPYVKQGWNRLVFQYSDACGGDYGNSDIYLSGSNFIAQSTISPLDAGTRVAIYSPKTNYNQDCTTNFEFTGAGKEAYEVVAKHCIDSDQGNQVGNDKVDKTQPFEMMTYAATPADQTNHTSRDQNIMALGDCRVAAYCLVPAKMSGQTGDMAALLTDSAQEPMVQTDNGVLPVLGKVVPAAGSTICHYGTGSYLNLGDGEQCGQVMADKTESKICKDLGCNGNTKVAPLRGAGGDSGGPVYQYVRNSARSITGVNAVGMEISVSTASRYGYAPGQLSIYTPVGYIETRLGLNLTSYHSAPTF
jgi:hypothetical protein